uniref:uncharacterized protein LOC122589667 n=1 Tax=Erigeron canadensis TaxID=72917 RepID=UPI001CB91C7D|nr:uncharacterized protein LOC122589667 [Erigeron canadensis]
MDMEKQERRQSDAGAAARKKLPSPREMVAHYESKGMQPHEASLKVIDDLQNLLFKVVTTNKNAPATKEQELERTLGRLESKLDSKPGFPQTLAIGFLSGAIFPQLANIFNNARLSSSSS